MDIYTLPLGGVAANCFLLESEEKFAIIDPGEENHILKGFCDSFEGNIEYIILTHGHFDHIGGVAYLKERFPGAKIAIGREDAEKLESTEESLGARFGVEHKTAKADVLLKDGDVVTVGSEKLQVIATPGHTKGGITLKGTNFAFTGDTLFNGSIGRYDFPDSDAEELQESLDKLALLPDETVIYCGHGPESTIGFEKKYNPYLGEVGENI